MFINQTKYNLLTNNVTLQCFLVDLDMPWCAAVAQAVQSLLGGAVPGKAACGGLVPPLLIVAAAWPGMEYWGLNWAKLVP